MRLHPLSIICSLLAMTMVATVPVDTLAPQQHARAAAQKYWVYWDQNEEEDFYQSSSGKTGQLIKPWDPNGQMCILPDGSGRFVTGYNPTIPSQHNPGSKKPLKNPPVGEAVWNRNGGFTGKTIYVPGPYHLPGSKKGGDIPPDKTAGGGKAEAGAFNNNGTFTGCAFDPHAWAVDGTSSDRMSADAVRSAFRMLVYCHSWTM